MSAKAETATKADNKDTPNKRKISELEEDSKEIEEEKDEWTTLASTYTDAFMPAFRPIYKQIADDVLGTNSTAKMKILDFGCGPGEPSMTICQQSSHASVVGIDSTPAMLAIANERLSKAPQDLQDRLVFERVLRSIPIHDFKDLIIQKSQSFESNKQDTLDAVVSAFTVHYIPFPRRVELLTSFLELSPAVLWITWGHQSKVPFLRAIKLFSKWKFQDDDTPHKEEDICKIQMQDEDDGSSEAALGSFTMCRRATFQSVVDKVNENKSEKTKGSVLKSFEKRRIPLVFTNVQQLLSFLPFPKTDEDVKAVHKLLKHWDETLDEVKLNPASGEIKFETEVVFSRFERG